MSMWFLEILNIKSQTFIGKSWKSHPDFPRFRNTGTWTRPYYWKTPYLLSFGSVFQKMAWVMRHDSCAQILKLTIGWVFQKLFQVMPLIFARKGFQKGFLWLKILDHRFLMNGSIRYEFRLSFYGIQSNRIFVHLKVVKVKVAGRTGCKWPVKMTLNVHLVDGQKDKMLGRNWECFRSIQFWRLKSWKWTVLQRKFRFTRNESRRSKSTERIQCNTKWTVLKLFEKLEKF